MRSRVRTALRSSCCPTGSSTSARDQSKCGLHGLGALLLSNTNDRAFILTKPPSLSHPRIWIFFAGVWIVRAPILVGLDALPSSAAFLFLFVSCSAAKWSWNNFSGGTKRFLTVFKWVYIYFLLPLYRPLTCVDVFSIVFGLIIVVANIWIVAIGDPKSFNTSTFSPDRAEYSFFTLNLLTLVLWIISWLSTSAWPWGKTLTWDKLQ